MAPAEDAAGVVSSTACPGRVVDVTDLGGYEWLLLHYILAAVSRPRQICFLSSIEFIEFIGVYLTAIHTSFTRTCVSS